METLVHKLNESWCCYVIVVVQFSSFAFKVCVTSTGFHLKMIEIVRGIVPFFKCNEMYMYNYKLKENTFLF